MRKLVPTLLSNATDFGGGGCAAAFNLSVRSRTPIAGWISRRF